MRSISEAETLLHFWTFFYKNKLLAILRKFYESGKPIYGGSAGAIIFGKDIRTVEEENDRDYPHVDGFDMCGGVSIICHYDGSVDRKIYNFTETFSHKVIALPEDAGVLFENSRVSKVFGNPIIFTQSKKDYLAIE